MKSYAVDSIYACIIVMIVFLMLPFFVPYDGVESRAVPVGEYSIDDEEKPEVFTRIIDRVSSFYRLKRKNKSSLNNPNETKTTEKGKLSASEKSSNGKSAKAENEDGKESASEANSLSSKNKNSQPRKSARSGAAQDMAELNGEVYKIMPDPYGNKYVITKAGPVPLKSFLNNGGRIVRPDYNYDNSSGQNDAGKSAVFARRGTYSGANDADIGKTYKAGHVSGFKHGKLGAFSSDSRAADVNEKSFSGSGGSGFSVGSYDFSSGKDFEDLKHNISSQASGGGKSAKSEAEGKAAAPKAYVLQDSMPLFGENALPVSIKEDINVKGAVEFDLDDGWGNEKINAEPEVVNEKKETVSVAIVDNAADSAGIMPQNMRIRKEMTKALLGDKNFEGVSSSNETIPDPWILPNDVGNTPGKSFFEANKEVLTSTKDAANSKEWIKSDEYYNQVRADIQKTSGGKPIPLAIIDGQKDPYTMNSMPASSYYYQTAKGLLNNNVIPVADKDGGINLNRLDKSSVLVVVPEKPLAENLKKDGYNVAVFNYLVTPQNLENFCSDTSNAVKSLEKSKKADKEAKKKDITRSLSEIRP